MEKYHSYIKHFNKEGHVFIIVAIFATILMHFVSTNLAWIGLICTSWCIYFFRDPARVVPINEGLIVAPADGFIKSILITKPPQEMGLGDSQMFRISIVLGLLDVHVNRIPIDGKVIKLDYNPGKFINASFDKASIHNERQSVLIQTKNSSYVGLVQIAGLINRRIVCDLEKNDDVKVGERYGIIRFGSRVDLYLPLDSTISVNEGQTCVAGETVLSVLYGYSQPVKPDFKSI